MKHFKLIGPETTREFDVEDDEMVEFSLLKIKDFEKRKGMSVFESMIPKFKNEKIYKNCKHYDRIETQAENSTMIRTYCKECGELV